MAFQLPSRLQGRKFSNLNATPPRAIGGFTRQSPGVYRDPLGQLVQSPGNPGLAPNVPRPRTPPLGTPGTIRPGGDTGIDTPVRTNNVAPIRSAVYVDNPNGVRPRTDPNIIKSLQSPGGYHLPQSPIPYGNDAITPPQLPPGVDHADGQSALFNALGNVLSRRAAPQSPIPYGNDAITPPIPRPIPYGNDAITPKPKVPNLVNQPRPRTPPGAPGIYPGVKPKPKPRYFR